MNGAHDLGGMDGFGPVLTEADEPMFHAEWERRAFAITLAAGMHGRWNIDMARFAREDTDPLTYLRSTYYEQWLRGLERLLVEKALVSANELASGKATSVSNLPPVRAEQVPPRLLKGATARRPDAGPPRFSFGEAVRVRNLNPRGHTRMPRYCRGKLGVIERDHGTYVFPDTHAASGDERPQRCYAVSFTAEVLWGEGASPNDRVLVDLWDDYLEPA
jgi:nitrile hydratase beta subunit